MYSGDHCFSPITRVQYMSIRIIKEEWNYLKISKGVSENWPEIGLKFAQ